MAWERIVVFTPSCASGGIAWFENLQVPDISFLLPVLSALTWIGTFKVKKKSSLFLQLNELYDVILQRITNFLYLFKLQSFVIDWCGSS